MICKGNSRKWPWPILSFYSERLVVLLRKRTKIACLGTSPWISALYFLVSGKIQLRCRVTLKWDIECTGVDVRVSTVYRVAACQNVRTLLRASCRTKIMADNLISDRDCMIIWLTSGLWRHSSSYVWVGLAQSVITTRYGLDGSGIESRCVAWQFAPFRTGPEAHPSSYTMGTGSFPGYKAAGAWRWLPTTI